MMIKQVDIFKNQSGVALVIALIMMIVMTVIVLAASFTSIFEIKLAGNKRGSTDAFYASDSGMNITLASVANFGYTGNSTSLALNPNPTGAVVRIDRELKTDGTPRDDAPRGIGMSATHFEFGHHLAESTGRDQIDIGPMRSTCTIREKVVQLLPTLQGGAP
jgi:type IV pilus assembly protein PilX